MSSYIQGTSMGSHGSPMYLSDDKTMVFTFHNFEDLTEKKEYKTTNVECHDYQWFLGIYPWGSNDNAQKDEAVSIFLYLSPLNSAEKVKSKFSFQIGSKTLIGDGQVRHCGRGWIQFMKRQEAIQSLDENGSLVVTVRLRCWLNAEPVWTPENPLKRKLHQLHDSGDKADTNFIMQNGDEVRAHKFLVSLHCPLLEEIISEAANPNKIVMDGPDPHLFAALIRFMYHESLPSTLDMKRDGLELLKLANQYDYVDLKLHLEGELVRSKILSVDNAAEILLLADSHACALLKERAMKFVLGKFGSVKKSKGWTNLTESSSLVTEILEAQNATPKERGESVSALRKKLADMGQDVDGTKEMLIQRLKEHSK